MSDLGNPYAAPRTDSAAPPSAVELPDASMGVRFLNFIIDQVVRLILMSAVGVGLLMGGVPINGGLLVRSGVATLGIVVYYLFFEGLFAVTPGKLLTRTRVVDARGGKPRFLQILGRTFSRLVPFEPFSFFNNPAVGWHDRWSGTRVVRLPR
jgi:uncharacterized RDD family membrane protein YckC